MTVNLSMFAGAGAQLFDNNGVILSGGLIYTYAAGTTTPQTTYTTSAGSAAHTNPIVLDSAGRIPSGGEIWLTDSINYKFVLKTSAAVTIGTYDNVPGNASGIYATFAASSGSSLVGYLPAGTAAVATTVQAKLRQLVSPKDFGAVGDGTTDDLTAVKNALESGYVVDGGGFTYAISGTCTPTSFVGLQNANFTQIGNNATANVNTLNIVGFNNFFIDNVTINMGTNVATLFADDGNNGLYVAGSAYNNESRNFRISRVTVTGNGCGTGIHVRHAERFTVTNCLVRDRISGSSPDPTNDSQNGFQINNCANFVLANCNVYNLTTRLASVDTNKWTRGFLFVEIRDSTIVGCNATISDQGFDFSGGYVAATNYIGNRRFVISACTANASGTYGFKFANVTRDGLVSGCIANNTGTIAFVFSPSAVTLPTGLEKYNTQNIDVVGCKVSNVLGTGWSSTNAQGFRVMTNSVYTDYPRAIRLKDCSVTDTQDTPTTTVGYSSDSLIPLYPTTGYSASVANTTQGCTVGSGITTPFDQGGYLGPNICLVTGTSTQSLSNNTDTELLFDLNLIDFTRLHSVTSNTNNIYIKTTGWYDVRAQIQFATNGTGARQIRFLQNGASVNRTTAVTAAPSTAGCTVVTARVIYFKSGDYVSVSALQTSGGALNVNLNESNFSVTLVS